MENKTISNGDRTESNSEIDYPRISKEDLKSSKECFEKAKKSNREWLSQMPEHIEFETPDFLRDKSLKEERIAIVEKLKELLKSKFSLATISDILLYNDYENLDEVIEDKKDFSERALTIYSDFGYKFKKKVGPEDSRVYSAEEAKLKAVLEFIEKGDFLRQEDPHILQDAISSIVDTASFSNACRIETEFLDSEISVLLNKISELEARNELEDLMLEADGRKKELRFKLQAYQTIEELINSKSKGKSSHSDYR